MSWMLEFVGIQRKPFQIDEDQLYGRIEILFHLPPFLRLELCTLHHVPEVWPPLHLIPEGDQLHLALSV